MASLKMLTCVAEVVRQDSQLGQLRGLDQQSTGRVPVKGTQHHHQYREGRHSPSFTASDTRQVSCEDYEQKLKSKGHNATHCRGVCQYMKQVDSGSIRPTASDDFKTLTGQSPMTLDMYAREMAPMLRQ